MYRIAMMRTPAHFYFFFFNDTATTEIYTLSLHDALPILLRGTRPVGVGLRRIERLDQDAVVADRKSTRLNSSHSQISYAVFCLKKKRGSRRARSRSNDMPHDPSHATRAPCKIAASLLSSY